MENVDLRAAIYGTISIGALLSAESVNQETYAATVGAVTITLLIYVLVHAYSDYTGERLASGEPLKLGALGRTILSEGWLLVGAGIPLVALLLSWVLDASLSTAVTVAVWTSAVMVLILEVVSGVRAGESGRELAFQAAAGAFFGLLVIVLRVVLH
ncbi:MAG: hypothetical protein JO243_17605 [Solirubrobacterales bacterium]|nr:hypothetical protein [Solirubrobacterales bacterium]